MNHYLAVYPLGKSLIILSQSFVISEMILIQMSVLFKLRRSNKGIFMKVFMYLYTERDYPNCSPLYLHVGKIILKIQ